MTNTFAKDTKTHSYEIYALLWVSRDSEAAIGDVLSKECDVPRHAIQRGLHLTIYHGRRPLPGLAPGAQKLRIAADISETRFMVLAPGGENPRPELEPRRRSVGIRLTRRNHAIPQIQELRESVYRFETPKIVGQRNPTSAWVNCFGARHYQPHIKLLRPGSQIERDLTPLGALFRSELAWIEFSKFEIRCGPIG